jgi:glutathione synthase
VLSDPETLACAGPDKLYTLGFPPEFRPPTLVTRDPAAVAEFVDAHRDGAVIKPLHGGAGDSVFLVRRDEPNLDQIISAVGRRGYLVVQPYLPAVAEGSIRLFLLDGDMLTVDGEVAALRLLPTGADIRTNFHVSHTVAPAGLDDAALVAARAVGPRLAKDGMFLVGLDIVGGLILEANLHAAGGLRGAERLTGADFSGAVLAAVETRVARV